MDKSSLGMVNDAGGTTNFVRNANGEASVEESRRIHQSRFQGLSNRGRMASFKEAKKQKIMGGLEVGATKPDQAAAAN
jgi:hypothetical protein